MDLNVILTSVFSSALVSGLFVFLNAYLDRRSRVKELQFKIAFELAHEQAKMVLDIAKSSQQSALILDPIHRATEYHAWVKHFYDKGVLPEDAIKIRQESEKLNGM